MPRRPGPQPMLDLEDYVPGTTQQAGQLFEAIMTLGDVSAPKARGIVGTLLTLPEGRYSDTFSVQLVGYRKILARLDGPPWEDIPAAAQYDDGAKGAEHSWFEDKADAA